MAEAKTRPPLIIHV